MPRVTRIEPDDQVTVEPCRESAADAATHGSWARGALALCALVVVAASVTAAWALGVVAAIGIFVAGTLTLVAALLILARGAGRP